MGTSLLFSGTACSKQGSQSARSLGPAGSGALHGGCCTSLALMHFLDAFWVLAVGAVEGEWEAGGQVAVGSREKREHGSAGHAGARGVLGSAWRAWG